MADNDDQSSADPGMPGSPGDPNVPPDAPGYPEAGAPKAQPVDSEAAERKKQEVLNEARQKAYIEQLERNYYESAQRGQKMFTQIQESLQNLQKVANAPPPAPPRAVTAPPPPTQQQQGGLSEFVFNLLKFGALVAVAYGTSGRGLGHNAVYKAAIGAALEGYASGRNDVVNASMRLWEKNREIINDTNREQNANYRAIMADQRLALTQKIDILNGLSKSLGDYRTYQDSQNTNLMNILKAIDDREKLQQHKEDWENKNRDKLYDVLGKNQITDQYLAWLWEKSGGTAKLTGRSSPDEWYRIEKDHPEWSFSEFIRFHEQEEIRKATEKKRSETEVRKEVKEGATPTPQDPEAAKKAAKILEGLVQ